MGEVLLGAVALVAIILLVRAFVGADPKALVKALRYVGAGALLLAAIGLVALDRVGAAVFVASAAWGLYTPAFSPPPNPRVAQRQSLGPRPGTNHKAHKKTGR